MKTPLPSNPVPPGWVSALGRLPSNLCEPTTSPYSVFYEHNLHNTSDRSSHLRTENSALFFFFFLNLTYSRWTSSLPSCLWSLRIFPSLPGSRLAIFYRDASSALLQLVNQWLNFTYSRSHAFRYERKNTNPTLVRIELTTSALAGVQVTYYTARATLHDLFPRGTQETRFYRKAGIRSPLQSYRSHGSSDEGTPGLYGRPVLASTLGTGYRTFYCGFLDNKGSD